MGFLDWLFGKKGTPATTAAPEKQQPARADQPAAPGPGPQNQGPAAKPARAAETQHALPAAAVPEKEKPSTPHGEDGRKPSSSEVDNLRRWRESGQARAWVQARAGRWTHADWLALLDELKRSPFWPMLPDAIGLALEEEKQQLGLRN
jgi:hypothetical protein